MSVVGAGEEALWALQQLVPDRGLSNVAQAVDLAGPVDRAALRDALTWLLDRQSALRTAFPAVGGTPVRRVLAVAEVTLEPEEVTVGEDGVDVALRRYAARPFDLEHAPLFRAGVVETADRHVICLVLHHIISDGVGNGRLVEELGGVYEAITLGRPLPVLAAPVEPPPFVPTEAAVAFWRRQVDGYPAGNMTLAGGRAFTGEPTFAGDIVHRDLDPETRTAVLAPLRKQCRSTDAMVLLAAYYLTLRRLGAAEDMMVGVAADTRRGEALRGIGYLTATVPLRVGVPTDISFTELVARVTRASFAGLEHGPAPFEVLADAAVGEWSGSPDWWRTRLVRHMFNYWPHEWASEPFGDDSVQSTVDTGLARLDLELAVQRIGQSLRVHLVHSTEVHDTDYATRFLAQYEQVLRQAATDPDRAAGDFDLCSPADHGLAASANDTDVRWPGPATVPGLIAAAAAERPEAVAVEHGGTATTYAQLLAAAAEVREQVLRYSGPVVGVALPRGVGAAAAILGVWAAGRGYLPLDPTHPTARLEQQLAEADCRLVFADDLPDECRRERTCLPAPDVASATGTGDVLPEPPEDAMAYLIFTSGSTGRPKGVVLTHANLANVVRHFRDRLHVRPGDAMAWLTTFAFDISVLELVLPLASGGRVVVADDEVRLRPESLMDLVERCDVRIIQATPTTWRLAPWPAGGLAGRLVLCGGEPLPPALARDLVATGARVFNVYGPTETTIWSTEHEVTDPDAPVTVGRPIANTRVHLLDERGHPQPTGLPGELCVAGAGVALGYHERPELTAERFVDSVEHGRYYRTGDLARRLPDGTIALLGRADRQIKLRAHRIELGEVESVLADHSEVTAAAVVVAGDPGADGMLVAFVVATARAGLTEDVWTHAATVLPGYAVPSRVIALDALPTTPNGKVDHTALTELAVRDADASDPGPVEEPEDPVVDTLVGLWRTTLNRPGLAQDSNFFLSGGHSLLAARLAAVATDRLGVPITMATVFRAPTPTALAAHVRAGAS